MKHPHISGIAVLVIASVIGFGDAFAQSGGIAEQALLRKFERSPDMIDKCALKLAHGKDFDRSKDWPAYCNTFHDTPVVQERVAAIREDLTALRLTNEETNRVQGGKVWIGMSAKAAAISWGRPERINRTTTPNGAREQWVYGGQNYLYFEGGKLAAIQN